MTPRIIFGIQSAVHDAAVLTQLVDSLGGRTVLIHHDFTQQPQMRVNRPNVHWVPEPVRTGWGVWNINVAIFKTIEHALRHWQFDYFQLLSPVDLPLRPVREFEAYIQRDTHDAAIDHVFLDQDPIALMCFAYRAVSFPGAPGWRVLWKLNQAYFDPGRGTVNRNGLAFPPHPRLDRHGRPTIGARLAGRVTRAWYAMAQRRLDPAGRFRLAAGGTWFGANRRACEALIAAAADPALERRFSRLFSPDELVLPTVLAGAGLRLAPGNLAVSTFESARPRWIDEQELLALGATGRFFARKFPDDPHAPVRRALLARLASNDGVAA
ncbi:MAG: beta-1,6-N-acetylglucosaminyltransferase [Burkholderiaceae bacterium]